MKSAKYIRQSGFNLIEVLIALVIVAVGVLGISKIQGVFVQNSSNANQRVVAASIAQKKIDDLRSFVNLTTVAASVPDAWTVGASGISSSLTPSQLAFTHIQDDQGGAPIGSTGLLEGTQTVGNYTYNLSWDVTDYWQGSTASDIPSTTPPIAGAVADEKLVTVTVAWTDELGDPQNVTLSTVINAYAPALTALSGKVAPGGEGPKVSYTPLAAPDVVPVSLDIGGKKKESSKPLPDLSKKGKSTVVSFQTVTYTDNLTSPGSTAVRQEDFETALCSCTSSGSPTTNSYEKGSLEFDSQQQLLVDTVSTVTGVSINKTAPTSGGDPQDPVCQICCRDSADVGTQEFKACRLKRINGVFRVYEPWRMIAFNLIPSSYFNTDVTASTPETSVAGMDDATQAKNISLYSDYVIEKVRAVLDTWKSDPSVVISPDTDFESFQNTDGEAVNNYVNVVGASTIEHRTFNVGSSNHRQLQARAVFMDVPPNDIYESGLYSPLGDGGVSAVPLDRVPFYEVNLTQIAGWIPDVEKQDPDPNGDGSTVDNTGDLVFDDNYTNNHDQMDNAGSVTAGVSSTCAQNNSASPNRNYVTNEAFYIGGGTTTTCINASRGDFYPVSTIGPSTPSTRIFTSNEGIVDYKILPLAPMSIAEDSIELVVQ